MPKPSRRSRVQHVVTVAGEPGVDQDHAVAVGDQGPVDQVGVSEADAIGDGRPGAALP